MRTDILILILGMMLATYIPRMLPAVLLEKLHAAGAQPPVFDMMGE